MLREQRRAVAILGPDVVEFANDHASEFRRRIVQHEDVRRLPDDRAGALERGNQVIGGLLAVRHDRRGSIRADAPAHAIERLFDVEIRILLGIPQHAVLPVHEVHLRSEQQVVDLVVSRPVVRVHVAKPLLETGQAVSLLLDDGRVIRDLRDSTAVACLVGPKYGASKLAKFFRQRDQPGGRVFHLRMAVRGMDEQRPGHCGNSQNAWNIHSKTSPVMTGTSAIEVRCLRPRTGPSIHE